MGAPVPLEALMRRYVGGDARSFDALYERTSQRVFSYQMMMTGKRSRAEDLCQTTFLKLHRARGGWIDGSPVMPWLMAIARNVFLDDARKRGRARVRITASGELPDQVDQQSVRPPATGLKEAIDGAINALPPRQREAFILTKHTGLSPREAARVLGITETAVKLRVFRANQALRSSLEAYRTP